jgi:hypothetical protein
VGFDLSSWNGDTHYTPRSGAEVIFNAVGSPVLGARLNCLLTGDDGGNYRFQDFYHIESHLFGLGTLKRDLTASGEFLEKLPPGF